MGRDNQTRILDACCSCIAENGVRGMRVQDVAKKAGVSSGLLYYHFTDRDGLLAAALEYVNVSALVGRSPDRVAETGSSAELRAMLLDEISDDEGVRAKSIVWNEIRAIAVFEPLLADHLATSTTLWQNRVAVHVQGASGLTSEKSHEIALLLTALVEGLSGRWLSGLITTDQARSALQRGVDTVMQTNLVAAGSQPAGLTGERTTESANE